MATEVKCAIYKGDPRVIDKKTTLVKSLECKIVDPFDIVNPTIIINNDNSVENCNYFVIGFRKYFKLDEFKTSNKMLKIRLHEDVLSTWMPKVYVVGTISNASEIISENMQQNYPMDVNKRVCRIKIDNAYDQVRSKPIIVVQSTQPILNKL